MNRQWKEEGMMCRYPSPDKNLTHIHPVSNGGVFWLIHYYHSNNAANQWRNPLLDHLCSLVTLLTLVASSNARLELSVFRLIQAEPCTDEQWTFPRISEGTPEVCGMV